MTIIFYDIVTVVCGSLKRVTPLLSNRVTIKWAKSASWIVLFIGCYRSNPGRGDWR